MLGAAALSLIVAPAMARAARVSGTLTGYESSTPLASRDLHFQNEITGDVFLTPTHADGGFAASLPPGIYSLRTETGAVLKHNIRVGSRPVSVGAVSELAPLAPARLFDYQSIAPSILTSAAPSTAYIMTLDRTLPPPSAPVVPKPQINWSRLPPGTQASRSGENVVTRAPSNRPVERPAVPSGTNAAVGMGGGVVGGPAPTASGMGGQPAAAMPPATQ
jgi:hypothetical protein